MTATVQGGYQRIKGSYQEAKDRRQAIPAKYRLGLMGHLETWLIWVFVVGKLIKWAVSALYFLIFQVRYVIGGDRFPWFHMYWGTYAEHYHGPGFTYWWLKDVWDHAPRYVGHWLDKAHLGALLHTDWLKANWVDAAWVTPRHDARNVYIGLFAGIAIVVLTSNALAWKERNPGFLTKTLHWPTRRQRKRTTGLQFTFNPLLASITGFPGFLLGVFLVSLIPSLVAKGLTGGSFWDLQIEDIVGAHQWQLIFIGLLASFVFAKYFTMKPGSDLALFHIERTVDRHRPEGWEPGQAVKPHKLWLRPPVVRNRYRMIMDRGLVTATRGVWSTRFMIAIIAVGFVLAGFGAWLTIVGPAAHAVSG